MRPFIEEQNARTPRNPNTSGAKFGGSEKNPNTSGRNTGEQLRRNPNTSGEHCD